MGFCGAAFFLRRSVPVTGTCGEELLQDGGRALADDAAAAAAAAGTEREIERRESGLVLDLQSRAARGEKPDDGIAAADGGVKRRVAGVVERVDVHAAIEEQPQRLDGAVRGRRHDADAFAPQPAVPLTGREHERV